MTAPLLLSRVEELDHSSRVWVDRAEVGAFKSVTVKTRVSQVFRSRLTAMFPSGYVIDFMRIRIEILVVRSLAILASFARPFDHFEA